MHQNIDSIISIKSSSTSFIFLKQPTQQEKLFFYQYMKNKKKKYLKKQIKQHIYKKQLILKILLPFLRMKKTIPPNVQNQKNPSLTKTSVAHNHTQRFLHRHSLDKSHFPDCKQNEITSEKLCARTNRKINSGEWNEYGNRETLLRKMIESNDRKRSDIFNSLIKKKSNLLKRNIRNDVKFNKMARIKTQEVETNHQRFDSSRIFINENNQKFTKLARIQTVKNLDASRLSDKRNTTQKLTAKDSEFLRNSFNLRLKEIKMRKYLHQQSSQQTRGYPMQGYSSTLKGQDHEQNQDSICFSDGIYVLCDGHGSSGKQVSSFVAQHIHNSLRKCVEEFKIDESTIFELYRKIDLQLDHANFDTSFSGCTCVAIVRVDNSFYSINLGDSKAIMAKGLNVIELSKCHKPDDPQQKLRIEDYGGVVKPNQISKDKFVGPMRIWAPGKNSWGPGLAMSRAFGDKASRRYGVISVPQVMKINLTLNERFIVIGSDGLFDFFDDHQICDFVNNMMRDKAIQKCEIAEHLVNEARKRWLQNADDITCILIFL